ncbi:MAG TPA: hypothetical protein PKD54_02680 [Pirellulaceae bacterium]|nr:hypothetical protein [Pirellulaceae bacterium]
MFVRSVKKSREQPLLWLFPAALVLAGYAFGIALPAQREQSRQATRLESLQTRGIDQDLVEMTQTGLEMTRREVGLLKTRLDSQQERLRTLSLGWRSQESRLETVREITKLAKEHNLSVLTQQFETKQQLSEYLQRVVQMMEQQTPDARLEYWQVQLGGRYRDMSHFLSALDTSRVKMIPVLVTMKASAANDGNHLWTVVFIV